MAKFKFEIIEQCNLRLKFKITSTMVGLLTAKAKKHIVTKISMITNMHYLIKVSQYIYERCVCDLVMHKPSLQNL